MATQSQIRVWDVAEPYIELNCGVGEGPFFEEKDRTLRFVDVPAKKFYRFHVDKGPSSLECIETVDPVTVTWDIEGDDTTILVGAKYGIAFLNRYDGNLKYITRFYTDDQKAERMRANDGALDPIGRCFCGTMTEMMEYKLETEGSLFALETSAATSSGYALRTIFSPVTVPNGLGWSSDGKTMYHVDSTTYTIWKFDYDVTQGTADNRRPWFVVKHHEGAGDIPLDAAPPGSVPDGFDIDVNGDIWCAVWGGSKVLQIRDLDGQGKVVGCVKLPATQITCPRFVDEDLVITSANQDGAHWGGSVFRVHVGVRGAVVRKWKPAT